MSGSHVRAGTCRSAIKSPHEARLTVIGVRTKYSTDVHMIHIIHYQHILRIDTLKENGWRGDRASPGRNGKRGGSPAECGRPRTVCWTGMLILDSTYYVNFMNVHVAVPPLALALAPHRRVGGEGAEAGAGTWKRSPSSGGWLCSERARVSIGSNGGHNAHVWFLCMLALFLSRAGTGVRAQPEPPRRPAGAAHISASSVQTRARPAPPTGDHPSCVSPIRLESCCST